MKKIAIILNFLLISLILFSENILPSKEILLKSKETYLIVNDLYKLVVNNKSENKLLFDTVSYVKNKIDAEELLLLIDDNKNNNDILSGAFFVFSSDQNDISKPYIKINKNLLDVYSRQKSIIFSILIHEIKHAYDYFNYRDNFSASAGNLLEKYLYQMDALYLESLFIQNILVPNDFKITVFEKILLDSHKNDNLSIYSLAYETTDKDLIYYLYKIEKENKSKEEIFSIMIGIGNELINNFNSIENKEENDWKKYTTLISMNSLIQYGPQISYNTVYNRIKKIEPEKFNIKDHSKELYDLMLKISDLVTANKSFIISYQNKFYDMLKEDVYDNKKSGIKIENYILSTVIYLHLDPSDILQNKKNVDVNSYIGNTENFPEIMSEKFNNEINNSIDLYNNGKFREAAALLEKASVDDSKNPFVLNFYAKALYRFDREKSFIFYKKLIDLLDSQEIKDKYLEITQNKESFDAIKEKNILKEIYEINESINKTIRNKTIIDLWFGEAYWKLGTLYLDIGDYLKGIYEITRSGVTSDENNLAKEQAYSYLCESYCYLNKPALANYFADIVYKINPRNTYIKQFLDMLKK